MSKSERPGGDFGRASKSLFEAARGDHHPSDADRARVRDALARRLVAEAAAATTIAESARAVARKGGSARSLVRLSFGAAFVVSGALVIMNAYDSRSERTRTATQSAPVQATPSSMGEAVQHGEEAHVADEAPPQPSADNARVVAVSRSPGSAAARVNGRARGRPTVMINTPRESAKVGTTVATPARHGSEQPAATSAPPVGSREERSARKAAESRDEPSPAMSQPAPGAAEAAQTPRRADSAALADPAADRTELAFLSKIHTAMRKADARSALELCAEHERRWPNGTFVEEREGVRAIASCRLQSADSQARARAFLAAHPRTPLALSVAAACKPLAGNSDEVP